ncbi:MAG TPA: S8 family peptidase, partial [Chloroflexota bacterium]
MQPKHAPRSLLALLAAIVLALPLSVGAASAAPSPGQLDNEVARRLQITPESGLIPVIVEGAAGGTLASDGPSRARRAENRVRSGGGRVVSSSSLLGASIAELTPAQIRALANDASIGRIHFDAGVTASAVGAADGAGTGATSIVFQQTVGAPEVWQSGDTGQGVTVAVLDTGIDASNTAFGARVKARVDLVDPSHPAQGDPAGHGTHVAGIVAASRSFPSPGIAPDASLVSVRVLDQNGSSRVSTVVHGLEWVIAHKQALGIRVVVMALGAPATGSYRDDPLAAASEMAWRSGIVVVVAAGNGGPTSSSITTPGIDPLVLTVGATDEAGTAVVTDDLIPAWSSQGPTLDGLAKPDVVAPGRKIVSVRVAGSTIDRELPTHIESPSLTRLSGTSEATAVAAGAAALMLERSGHLDPDQVKAMLMRSTARLAGAGASAQGSGEINVARALRTPAADHVRQTARPSDAFLQMLAAMGRGVLSSALHLNGSQVNWDQVNWDQVNWDQVNWDHVNWDQVNWDQVNWDQVNWDQVNWDQVNWDQVN